MSAFIILIQGIFSDTEESHKVHHANDAILLYIGEMEHRITILRDSGTRSRQGPFLLNQLSDQAMVSNYTHTWYVNTFPWPNFNGGLVKIKVCVSKYIPYINYLRPSDAYLRQQTNHYWLR